MAVVRGRGRWAASGRARRPGGDLLSRVLRRSTIGAEGFHGRVRDGIGCLTPRHDHQVVEDARAGGRPARGFARMCDGRAERPRGGRALGASPCASGSDQAERAISTGRLHALLRVHPRPIDVVVYHGSSGRTGLEGGFPLRCLQRLSRPHIATRRCRWRDNRYTRGASFPVLSY